MRIWGHTFKAVQLSQKRTYEIFFSSWNEKGCREVMSHFLSKNVENSCMETARVNKIDVIYFRRNIATTRFTLYGPCQLNAYMPYVPAGQKNPGILIPKNLSRWDTIFPVIFALSRNPCGLSNALHFQTSGLAKYQSRPLLHGRVTQVMYSVSIWHLYNDVVKCLGQKKKICEFTVTCWKKLGSVGRHFYFYFIFILILEFI